MSRRRAASAARPRWTPLSWPRSSDGATCWPVTSPCATPAITQRQLNFAVQHTIDRIIFLRIAEDRGIEQYGTLLGLANGGEVYERLLQRFRHADARYNSGCFTSARKRAAATHRTH